MKRCQKTGASFIVSIGGFTLPTGQSHRLIFNSKGFVEQDKKMADRGQHLVRLCWSDV